MDNTRFWQYLSSREHLSNRINVAEDAIEGVRSDYARAAERQLSAIEAHATKLAEVDEKAFSLDKEILKLKMALPASVAARMSAGSQSFQFMMPVQHGNTTGVAADQKLDELTDDLKAMYCPHLHGTRSCDVVVLISECIRWRAEKRTRQQPEVRIANSSRRSRIACGKQLGAASASKKKSRRG